MPENYHQHNPRQKRQFWKNHVEQWQQSGFSQRAYCRKNGLNTNHFIYNATGRIEVENPFDSRNPPA